MNDAATLLEQTLGEESMTDEALTGLADASANEMAKARLIIPFERRLLPYGGGWRPSI